MPWRLLQRANGVPAFGQGQSLTVLRSRSTTSSTCVADAVCNTDPAQEDLTPETIVKVLDELKAGRKPKPGPQSGTRRQSEPHHKLTTLLEAVRAHAELE